jgi:hypothetical protein
MGISSHAKCRMSQMKCVSVPKATVTTCVLLPVIRSVTYRSLIPTSRLVVQISLTRHIICIAFQAFLLATSLIFQTRPPCLSSSSAKTPQRMEISLHSGLYRIQKIWWRKRQLAMTIEISLPRQNTILSSTCHKIQRLSSQSSVTR